MTWRNVGRGNVVLDIVEGTFISYNPSPEIGNTGHDETALVFPKRSGEGSEYYILNGDWRDAYEKAIAADGFGGALRVFEENKYTHRSFWSSDNIEEILS